MKRGCQEKVCIREACDSDVREQRREIPWNKCLKTQSRFAFCQLLPMFSLICLSQNCSQQVSFRELGFQGCVVEQELEMDVSLTL